MQSQARVVIVGGGVMGCSLLYHLAEAGWKDSLLIEKSTLTSGSTWHAAGLCTNFIANYTMAQINQYGVELYPKLEAETGQSVSWHTSGSLRMAIRPEEVDWFHQVTGIGRAIGFHSEVIGVDKLLELNPFVNPEGVLAAIWTRDDGHIDPAGVANAFAKGARNAGASIVQNNRVTGIKRAPDGDWVVQTEQGEVRCEHVVNAAGCYARQVSQMAGTDSQITNMMHTYVVTEPIPALVERDGEIPVTRDPRASAYIRQEQKSGLIGIYEHQSHACWEHHDGWPEWESEHELFDAPLERLAPHLERVMERMPSWASFGFRRMVCGGIPHTPDAYPLLGPAAGLTNFWQCNGASIGIAAGGGCGKYLAQWMMEGAADINMTGLDARRFGAYADPDYVFAKSHQDYRHMYVLHFPGDEYPAGRPARTSALYETLKAKGAQHTEAGGWERPKYFSPDGKPEQPSFSHNDAFELAAQECKAVRERVGVMDLSSFGKYEVQGRGATAMLDQITANRVPAAGRIALTHLLGEQGRILGELTITRLADEHYYLLGGAAAELTDFHNLQQAAQDLPEVEVSRVSDDWGVLVVAGPNARALLAELTDASLENADFPWLSAQTIKVAGVEVRALRVNYVGELGWELHCPMAKMPEVYAAIDKAGAAHGLADVGVYAVNSLRLEKAYKGWGAELTNEITLVEADSCRFFCPGKGDFRGRDATLARQKQGPAGTQVVYLSVDSKDYDLHGGEAVYANGKPVGITTSGGYGHYTGQSLGFAYVDPACAKPGTHLQVYLIGKPYDAKVLDQPVWDPGAERSRS